MQLWTQSLQLSSPFEIQQNVLSRRSLRGHCRRAPPEDYRSGRGNLGGRDAPGGRGRRGYQGGRGYQGNRGRGRGRGRGMERGHGEPWTEEITTRWYQGHELARMTEEQRQQMRSLREGRQVGSSQTSGYNGQAQYYPPPHPSPYYPPPPPQYPPPPPPQMPLPPLPAHTPSHNVAAVQQQQPYIGNRHHPDVNRFGQGFARGPPRF
jgi:hypothetical protein